MGREYYSENGNFYKGRAGFGIRFGRQKQFYTVASHNVWSEDKTAYYYTVTAGFYHPIFSELNMGYTGKISSPRNIIRLGTTYNNFEHILDRVDEDFSSTEVEGDEYTINLFYTRNDTIRLAWVNSLSLQYLVNSKTYRGRVTSQKYFKPHGRVLLSLLGEYGYTSKNAPGFYQFDLNHLNVYRYKRKGQALINGKLDIMLKIYKSRKARVFGVAEDYIPVLNCLVYEGFDIGAFIQASDVYEQDRTAETLDFSIIAGPEFQLLTSAFMGRSLDMKFFYAMPVRGYDDAERKFLFRFGMRF